MGGNSRELTADLLTRFEAYAWPGNIRELRNTVARRIALGDLALFAGSRSEVDETPSKPPEFL